MVEEDRNDHRTNKQDGKAIWKKEGIKTRQGKEK
jgi:hypothetical protein